jgi:hypothetical protein
MLCSCFIHKFVFIYAYWYPCQMMFVSFNSNTMAVTSGVVTVNTSRAHGFAPGFNEVRVTRSLVLCVMFGRSLFVHLSFLFWPLCCQFFFDLRILITPFVIFKLFYLHVQSVHITTNVVKSNPLIGRLTRNNIV